MKKTIAALLCSALLFTAASCTGRSQVIDPVATTENTSAGTHSPDESITKAPYDGIIESYKELLLCRKNGSAFPARDDTAESTANKEITDALYATAENCNDPSKMGYAVKDINRDGTDELVLLTKSCKLYALFTLADGQPTLLLNMGGKGAIDSDGTVYFWSGAQTQVKNIADGKLAGLEYGFTESDTPDGETKFYKIIDGEHTEITKQEKLALDDTYASVLMQLAYTTKITGFRFIPAIENDAAQNGAAYADLASYDDILSMYKTIVGVYSDYTKDKWVRGAYDDLYTFADNAAYETFHNVFYSGMVFMPTATYYGSDYADGGDNAYGYSKKDLNGDGVEELILLVDNFDIIAIFTMRDGKAVLLDSYTPRRAAWIDANGLIHVKNETGGLTGRDSEYFLYAISGGNLKCLFGIGCAFDIYLQRTGWYKIENGKQVSISEAEWNELYAQYDICPQYCGTEEYTKTFADLRFTHLFAHVQPSVQKYAYDPISEYGVTVTAVENGKVAFAMDYYKYDEFTLVYETVITATATPVDNAYVFDNGTVCGTVEFGVGNVWVTITESKDENIDCRAYLFAYIEED